MNCLLLTVLQAVEAYCKKRSIHGIRSGVFGFTPSAVDNCASSTKAFLFDELHVDSLGTWKYLAMLLKSWWLSKYKNGKKVLLHATVSRLLPTAARFTHTDAY